MLASCLVSRPTLRFSPTQPCIESQMIPRSRAHPPFKVSLFATAGARLCGSVRLHRLNGAAIYERSARASFIISPCNRMAQGVVGECRAKSTKYGVRCTSTVYRREGNTVMTKPGEHRTSTFGCLDSSLCQISPKAKLAHTLPLPFSI